MRQITRKQFSEIFHDALFVSCTLQAKCVSSFLFECTMLLPMSIGILEILKSKNSSLSHFFYLKTIIFPINDAEVSEFYNEYLVSYIQTSKRSVWIPP